MNRTVVDGKDGWICGWCDKFFKPIHATRAVWHLLKMKGMGIAVCKAAILEANRQLYQALYDCTNKKGTAMKRGRHNVIDIIVERQGRSVRGRVENSPASILSTTDLCGESVHSKIYPTQTSVVRTNNSLRNQPSIDAAVQKLYTQGDICVANNSRLEMIVHGSGRSANRPR